MRFAVPNADTTSIAQCDTPSANSIPAFIRYLKSLYPASREGATSVVPYVLAHFVLPESAE
jgi:hypothetical protein